MINTSAVGREELGAGRDVEKNVESCDSLLSEVICCSFLLMILTFFNLSFLDYNDSLDITSSQNFSTMVASCLLLLKAFLIISPLFTEPLTFTEHLPGVQQDIVHFP